MFERFTAESREVVVAAKRRAESLGRKQVNTEHLLVALVEQGDLASRVLTEAGLTSSMLNESLGIDRTALEYLGIDLEQVLSRAREMFPSEVARPSCSTVHFAAETKKALEIALREAIRLRDRHIGTEHILAGILRSPDNRACLLMMERDISPESLRSVLETEIRATS